MEITKQHLQILRILECKEFIEQNGGDLNKTCKRINELLPFGFKMTKDEVNLKNLNVLNNYSLKVLYGFWDKEVRSFISEKEDVQEDKNY